MTEISNATLTQSKIARVVTLVTLRPDITAMELAQLMSLQVTYTDEALKAMTPEQLALVERNSRPA